MAVAVGTGARPVGGTYTGPWRAEADAAADRNEIPRPLFRALIGAESSWNPKARSSAGATGLTQLMPATAAGLGVDPSKPLENLEGGARYLRAQFDRFGDWELALAAYNAGPGRVADGSWRKIPETSSYVSKVLAAAGDFSAKFGDWVEAGPGVNLDRVNSSLLGKLFLVGAATGKKVRVISGWRSDQEQTRIWDSGVRPAATPIARGGNGSKHTRGEAIDATIDGQPLAEVVDEKTLNELGLKSLREINDPAHVEEIPSLADAEIQAGAVGPGPALAVAAVVARVAVKSGSKVGSKLTDLLGKLFGKGGAAAGGAAGGAAGRLANYGTVGALLAALDIAGIVDVKKLALWLLFTLGGLALVLLGVLRLLGLKAGTVVNVVRGEGIE